MTAQNQKTSFVSSFLFTLLIIVLFVGSILFIDFFYKSKIDKVYYDNEYQIITEVVDIDFDNDPIKEKTIITSVDGKEKMLLYPLRQNGVISAVVIEVGNERGYGGYLKLAVGFYMDGTISGYRVISHNETVGLGSKITEKEFADQFSWFHPERQVFKVKKDGGDIDAITSATISSRAVIDSIQKAFAAYKKFIAGD